jgi:hypothetical protein
MNKVLACVLITLIFGGCINSGDEPGGWTNPDENYTIPEKNVNMGAVIVGMEKSQAAGNCPGSFKDHEVMSDILSIYTDNIVKLANEKATKSAVTAALTDAIAKYEFVVFYYSGHGGGQKFDNTGPEEVDNQDEFLCFYDSFMLDNEVWSIISKAKSRVFLIFDCCHSETMFRQPQFTFKKALKCMRSSRGDNFRMLCWSGCPDNTYSYGSPAGGMFTNAIAEHMMLSSTYQQLWDKVSTDRSLLKSQTPKQTIIGPWDMDAYIFQ